MAVAVEELLMLPSLKQAKVLAGKRGLSKTVNSISVLESTNPADLSNPVFPQGEQYGSEIVITGFLNATDNIQLQCDTISSLARGGEVGLILFYVGAYLPKVDPRLIQLADSLDFVLICMPEGDLTRRYSEVISDVMECIFLDRNKNNDFLVLDILTRISSLPEHAQSIDTAMKIIRDRIGASVILCDSRFHILNLAAWPQSLEEEIQKNLPVCSIPPSGRSYPCPFLQGRRLYRRSIRSDTGQNMELFLLKGVSQLDERVVNEVAEVTRLCINIWGKQHGEVAIGELVRAILRDEPMIMYRLAEIFHIEIASLHEMWILDGGNSQLSSQLLPRLRSFCEAYAVNFVLDVYDGRVIAFMSHPASRQDGERLMESVLSIPEVQHAELFLTRCSQLQTTADVRSAYTCYKAHLTDVRTIFPNRRAFSMGDLLFAQECRSTILQGEAALEHCLQPIQLVQADSEDPQLLNTLSVYLLDGDSSVVKTANLLFIHNNTVKYRLNRIADLCGYTPTRMPEALFFYRAAAVQRLLR